MKMKLFTLAAVLCQMPLAMMAQTEAEPVKVDTVVAADSSAAKAVSDAAKKEDEDYNVRELNPNGELSVDTKLPEVRFVTVGVSVGLGESFYRTDASSDGGVFSGRFGLNFDIPFGQVFSLQPELLFATRGGKFSISGTDVINGNTADAQLMPYDVDYKEHLFYLDIPINCKFSTRMNISKSLTGRGFISVAPVLCIGLSGKGKAKGLTYVNKKGLAEPYYMDESYKPMQNDVDNELAKAFYSNFEFAALFKIGYDFDAHYSVALGYQLGLSDLVNSGFADNEKTYFNQFYQNNIPSVHNNTLFITFGYNW